MSYLAKFMVNQRFLKQNSQSKRKNAKVNLRRFENGYCMWARHGRSV